MRELRRWRGVGVGMGMGMEMGMGIGDGCAEVRLIGKGKGGKLKGVCWV